MHKWELRVNASLIIIVSLITCTVLYYLKLSDWDITNIKSDDIEFLKFSIFMPVFYYLTLSTKQFNYYKKQLDFYKLKYTES